MFPGVPWSFGSVCGTTQCWRESAAEARALLQTNWTTLTWKGQALRKLDPAPRVRLGLEARQAGRCAARFT